MSANGTQEGGTTSFTYIDRDLQTIAQMVDSKEAQSVFFELMSKIVRSEHFDRGLQTSAHSNAAESGRFFVQ